MSLPDPSKLHLLSLDAQADVLAHLFEPCPVLVSFIQKKVLTSQHDSYKDLIEATRTELTEFLHHEHARPRVSKEINDIISAHPRLGPLKDKLSLHSSLEQKSLAGSEEEAQKLKLLNELYELTFPGLRFVVFVNGRPREEIMAIMTRRIKRGDIRQERREAFDAMCDIALDRARKLGSKL